MTSAYGQTESMCCSATATIAPRRHRVNPHRGSGDRTALPSEPYQRRKRVEVRFQNSSAAPTGHRDRFSQSGCLTEDPHEGTALS